MTVTYILKYYERLEKFTLDNPTNVPLTEDFHLEVDAILGAIVTAYGRLYTSSKGSSVLKKKDIPKHLRSAHDEIMSLRHERYSHNGDHPTIKADLEVNATEDEVYLTAYFRSSTYNGAPSHWRELFEWLDRFLKASFQDQLDRLSKRTGKDWKPIKLDMELSKVGVSEGNSIELGPLELPL